MQRLWVIDRAMSAKRAWSVASGSQFTCVPGPHQAPVKQGGIIGWFYAADVVCYFASVLAAQQVSGAIVEVGVQHGKSFIEMVRAADPRYLTPYVAVDVFDDQEKNVDNSGNGNRKIFTKHVNAYASSAINPNPLRNVHIIQQSSMDVNEETVLNATNGRRVAFYSVDGCHNFDCTLHDIEVAALSLHPQGLLMIDDYYNAGWPGVALAVGHFLGKRSTRLTPFAFGQNKLYLAHAEAVAGYRAALQHFCLAHNSVTDNSRCTLFPHCTRPHPGNPTGELVEIGSKWVNSPPVPWIPVHNSSFGAGDVIVEHAHGHRIRYRSTDEKRARS